MYGTATGDDLALHDSSNLLPPQPAKRQRVSSPLNDLIALLERYGCSGLRPARGASQASQPGAAPSEGLRVEDPRSLRRRLEAALTPQAAQDAFVAGLAEVVADEDMLRQALLPMVVTSQTNYANGDSLLRLTLNMQRVQPRVAALLLEKLPTYCGGGGAAVEGAGAADGGGSFGGGAGPHDGTSMPSLILGQLRWLEAVVDAGGLTDKVLQVLPVCPPQVQQQLVGFLPEVASPEEHERAVEALLGLLEQDTGFVACVLDALGDMQLEPALRAHAVGCLAQQLPAVEVDDLPALVRRVFLLASASADDAPGVAAAVRGSMHCVSPADPRLAVPDSKQKGAAGGRGRVVPEARVVRELATALQGGGAAAGALLRAIGALTEPRQHRPIDLWVLLLIWQQGGAPGGAGGGGLAAAGGGGGAAGQQARAAEAVLRRKVLEGQAGARWLEGAVMGHQAVAQDLWQPLAALAAAWSRAREAPLRGSAGQLYRCLFVGVDSTPHRQEVLQALHGHLGSGQQLEEDVALEALLLLARRHTPLLARFGAFLASVLDHLECFGDGQLRQVFEMFAALTAPAAAAASGSASAQHGGRFEDELHITLTKALAHASPVYKRIGIVGGLAMLRREAAAYAAAAEGRGPGDPDVLLEAWTTRAESLLRQCQPAPACMAFLLDRLTDAVVAGIPEIGEDAPAAGPAAAAGAAAGGGGGGGEAGAPLPRPLVEWLSGRAQDLLYEGGGFLADMTSHPTTQQQEDAAAGAAAADIAPLFAPGSVDVEDAHLKPALWFNLDGQNALCALRVLPIAAAADPRDRAKLAWMAPLLRLLATLTMQLERSLGTIDALLGCPLVLFDPALASDAGAWASLPGPSRLAALGALFHAVGWLREAVSAFAPQIGAVDINMATQGTAGDDARRAAARARAGLVAAQQPPPGLQQLAELQSKVLARLVQLSQLEALLVQLSATGGCAALLPDLARPLAGAALRGGGGGGGGGAAGGAAGAGGGRDAQAAPKPEDAQLSVLLPAAHLVADLHAKLKAVLGRARRPAFAAAAGGPAAAQLPPCVESLSLQDLASQLEPLLPALQQHLSLAAATIREPPSGVGAELLTAGLPGFDDAASRALARLDATSRPLDATAAARGLALGCMRVLTMLLGPVAAACAPLGGGGGGGAAARGQGGVAAVLKALAPAASTAASSSDGVAAVRLAAGAFDAAARLSCLASGMSDLELEMALLELQAAIVATASGGAPAPPAAAAAAAKLRRRLSRGAEALLKQTWGGGDDEAEEEGKGFCWKGQNAAISRCFCWKGQNAAISRLIALWAGHAPDASAVLLELAGRLLKRVPGGKVMAKEQLAPVEGYAALCVATFPAWYRVIFERLVALTDQLTAEALAFVAAPPAAGAAGGGAKGKGKKAAAAEAAAARLAECDPAAVDEVIARYQRASQAFVALVELSKAHQTRVGLLAQAIKLGAKHIDHLLRALPFWRAAYADRGGELVALIRDTQKGTKVMQTICNEAKAKRSAPLLSKAPAAKKSLERFIYEVKALFHELGEKDAVWIGNLKNRDLGGQVVGSQMYYPEDDEDEEGDAEEEYVEEGDEEEEEEGEEDEAGGGGEDED
ncbi:MAG: Fanconi anaemia protein FancD2 nuclease-domain-containing protein [Monoraphidium minutum]|nr:MAG: Fanconi anaemia protein FancD2 nuclease-domain-containing protein [Monoraphidium minutum]